MFLHKGKQLKEHGEKEEYPLYIKGIFVLEVMLTMLILPFIILVMLVSSLYHGFNDF